MKKIISGLMFALVILISLEGCAMSLENRKFRFEDYKVDNIKQAEENAKKDFLDLFPVNSNYLNAREYLLEIGSREIEVRNKGKTTNELSIFRYFPKNPSNLATKLVSKGLGNNVWEIKIEHKNGQIKEVAIVYYYLGV